MMTCPSNSLSIGQKRFLRSLFLRDELLLHPAALKVFGADASQLRALPWAVVRPRTREQVREFLAWADKEKVPVYFRGRGTNVVGDCVPDKGGIVLSTLFMNRVLEINPRDFIALVEPGVVTGTLQQVLRANGLFYPPDPASAGISTIGGNVNTNAGGLKALKYGVTRDYVLGLEAILPGGRVISCGGRNHKDVVGLDLTRLFVGSEGTLGFVSRIYLKLLPLPQCSVSILAGYPSLGACLQAARSLLLAGLVPCALEFMDREVVQALLATGQSLVLPLEGSQGTLLCRFDGQERAVQAESQQAQALLNSFEPIYLQSGKGAEEQALWKVRRLINQASFSLASDKLSLDVNVPRGEVAQLLQGIQEIQGIFARSGPRILTFGHLGDGNIHVNIMHDQGHKLVAKKMSGKIVHLVLGLGGSISGEHGVGLTKLPFLSLQLGRQERALMRQIKMLFDPRQILNPGKGY